MVPEESADWRLAGAGPRGYGDGYTGAFDTQAFEADGYGGTGAGTAPSRIRDTAAFERLDGFPGTRTTGRPRTTTGAGGRRSPRQRVTAMTMTDDDYGTAGKRRWPIVTGAACPARAAARRRRVRVLAVQPAASTTSASTRTATSPSSAAPTRAWPASACPASLTRSTLKVSQLGSSDQATLSQTISKSSVNDAQQLIDQLQSQVDAVPAAVDRRWPTWQAKNATYQRRRRGTRRPRAKAKAHGPGVDATRARSRPAPDAGPAAPRPRRSASRPRRCPLAGHADATPTTPAARQAPAPTAKPTATASARPRHGGRVSSMTMPSPGAGQPAAGRGAGQPPVHRAVDDALRAAASSRSPSLNVAGSLKDQHLSTIVEYMVAFLRDRLRRAPRGPPAGRRTPTRCCSRSRRCSTGSAS